MKTPDQIGEWGFGLSGYVPHSQPIIRDGLSNGVPCHRVETMLGLLCGPEKGCISYVDFFYYLSGNGIVAQPIYGDSTIDGLNQNSTASRGEQIPSLASDTSLNASNIALPGRPLRSVHG